MLKSIQTLHSHTTSSDGLLTHFQALNVCENNNISAIAFTDHDCLPDNQTINILRKNSAHSTKWIIGIEISSGLPKELGGGVSSGFHIVGLFVDPTNKALLNHCHKAQEARIERMKKIVKNLQNIGFSIAVDDCLKASIGKTVTLPHIVQALNTKSENLELIEKLRQKMKKNTKHNKYINNKYEEMMKRGKQQYPYVLFLSKDSYIPDVYVHYQYWTDMDRSVKLIRNAGGLAVLAHYFTISSAISYSMLDNLLREGRLDGAETVYGFGVSRSNTGEIIEDEREKVKGLVQKHKRIQSGGADAHKKQDFEDFAKERQYSSKTVGMAEKIIMQTNVSTRWSSF